MTKNNPYSKWLLHSVDCELFSNNLYEETLESLQELFKKIEVEWIRTPFVSSKKIFTDMMNKILELIAEYEDELDLEYEDYFNDVVSLESGWLKDFAKKELKKDYETPRSLASSVLFASAAGLGTYKEINNAQAQRISRDVSASLRTAYLTKEPTQKVIERLKKKEEVEKKNLKTETNTVSNTAFNLVDYLTFKKNKEVLVLSAILDSSTCDECASLHGIRYSAAEAPITPFHTRCRCELVPEAIFTEDNKFNSFDDWIDSLEENEKERVLGSWRYDLYKNGVKPHSFYNNGKRVKKLDFFREYTRQGNERTLFQSDFGGFVKTNYSPKTNEEELNLNATIDLAKQGKEIYLLKDINRQNISSPDAIVNNVLYEIKTITKESTNIRTAIKSAFYKAHKQADRIILNITKEVEREILLSEIENRVWQYKNIESVILEFFGKVEKEYSRNEILSWYKK